jgi:glucose-6-phosphate dehydrogenase assembly protein OpcA
MATTNAPIAQPVAQPIPGAVWRGRVLDAAEIDAALKQLWAKFAVAQPGGPQARASTLNLTVVTRSRSDASNAIDIVSRLSSLYPSRATILVADHERRPDADPGLEVEIMLLEQPATRGRPAVRFEAITVEVSAENEQQLASTTSPLLVVDLPDFLWWASGETGGELFDDLVAITDRLIVDTATVADVSEELNRLSDLVSRDEGNLRLSDFAWARIAPWRQLVTQFFDPPHQRPVLDHIDEVTISYGVVPDGRSGLSAALLLAGWLASRLGWQAPGEMVPIRPTPGSWRVTLRAGDRRRRRETVLTLIPSDHPAANCSLGSVSLAAHGTSAGAFRIERLDELSVITTSEVAGHEPVSRGIHAPVPTEPALLAAELHVFGRDLIYEQALAKAAILAPDPTPTESAE